jgi:DNA mismatch repair ATPase MutS
MLSSTSKPTLMMQQLNETRAPLSEKTLLPRTLAYFDEVFNDGAKIGAKLLRLALMHRGDGPMAEIP